MIKGCDILPLSWLSNVAGFVGRIITIMPTEIRDVVGGITVDEWQLNAEPEGNWSGIPLTPPLLLRNGFVLRRDDEHIEAYVLPNEFYVAFIKKDDGVFPAGSIIVNDELRNIQYVHELQLQYFARTGKQLPFNL